MAAAVVAPELGIPAIAAGAGGGFLGSLIQGNDIGDAFLAGAMGGVQSGIGGDLLGGGGFDFLGGGSDVAALGGGSELAAIPPGDFMGTAIESSLPIADVTPSVVTDLGLSNAGDFPNIPTAANQIPETDYTGPDFFDRMLGKIGIGEWAQDGALEKTLTTVAPAALTLGSALFGGGQDRTLKELRGIRDQAQSVVSSRASGALTPAQTAAVEQWKEAQKAKVRQYAAKSGISDASTLAALEAQVETQALAASANMEGVNLDAGLRALNIAGTAAGNAATAIAASDERYRQALQRAAMSYGLLASRAV